MYGNVWIVRKAQKTWPYKSDCGMKKTNVSLDDAHYRIWSDTYIRVILII